MKKTKLQKRLEVLKDALAQLKAKKIKANCGEVFEPYYDNYELSFNQWDDTSEKGEKQAKQILQKLLKVAKYPVCQVCARGALLISTIHKFNDFNLGQLNNSCGSFDPSRDENKRLMKLFSGKQLALMENAFEVQHIIDDEINISDLDDYNCVGESLNKELLTDQECIKSVQFGLKYDTPNKRLKAILKNAIKNKGIFKP